MGTQKLDKYYKRKFRLNDTSTFIKENREINLVSPPYDNYTKGTVKK